MELKIGFVGAGAMAEAILSGIIKTGLVPAKHVLASDINTERLNYLADTYGITTYEDNHQLVQDAQVVVMAVKPQNIMEVISTLKEDFTSEKLLISIAAGINIDALYKQLPENVPVARVMPNTPCLIGKGVCAVTFSANASEEQRKLTLNILEAVGKAHVVPEKLMNAVTGLSGSGPAYIYLIIEALSDAGVKAGLSREISLDLAVQTVIGSASMVDITKTHPAVLKEKVTSPGGTTIAALHVLESAGVRAALVDAVITSAKRSEELGKE